MFNKSVTLVCGLKKMLCLWITASVRNVYANNAIIEKINAYVFVELLPLRVYIWLDCGREH